MRPVSSGLPIGLLLERKVPRVNYGEQSGERLTEPPENLDVDMRAGGYIQIKRFTVAPALV